MPPALPIPIAIPDARRATALMYIELTKLFRAAIYREGDDERPDADLTLVAVAVLYGHADGHPMTASDIARMLGMPNSSVLDRLKLLIERGLIERIGRKYYIESIRARDVPQRDAFDLVLLQAFAVLGPHLADSDK